MPLHLEFKRFGISFAMRSELVGQGLRFYRSGGAYRLISLEVEPPLLAHRGGEAWAERRRHPGRESLPGLTWARFRLTPSQFGSIRTAAQTYTLQATALENDALVDRPGKQNRRGKPLES